MKLFVKRVISVAIAACLAVGGNAALIGQPAALFSSTAHAEEVNEENKVKFKYTIANGEVTITGVENAWYRDVVIPEEIDGYPVTTIGKSAFYNYTPASVIVPESVRKIEENAFTRCGDGTYIEIRNKDCEIYPSSETFSPGFAAVYLDIVIAAPKGSTTEEHCKKYGGAFVPLSDEVIEITSGDCGDGVHYSITNDGTMTLTGNGKFYNSGSSYYNIPDCGAYIFFVDKIVIDGNIEIGAYAFERFFRLKEISIPEGTETIGENAFYECKSLVSIDIPDSVKSIDNSAFLYSGIYKDKNNWENGLLYYGDALLAGDADWVPQEVVIKDGTRIIADDVFDDCTQITRVEIPDSVKCIEYNPFYRCESLKNVKATAEILRRVIRNATEEIEITGGEIPSWAFRGQSNLRSVKINDGITEIGERAFDNCTGLTSITIPDSVTSIGNSAFSGCTGLTSITIPDGITSIGNSAFSGCTGLTSVTIPEGVTSIGNSAFSGCTGLTSVTIPEGVTSIGNRAFENCTALSSISLPDSITEIGSSAFDSTALTSIRLPAGIEFISLDFIDSCFLLETIELPESMSSFYPYDCRSCPKLKEIKISRSNKNFSTVDGVLFNKEKTELLYFPEGKTGSYIIPDSVTTIGDSAFKNCTNLTSITIPDSVTTIGNGAFENCANLTSITIPDSVTVISYSAFENCTRLTSIKIPMGVTRIERDVFANCTNLVSVTIPAGAKEIDDCAFRDCTSLTSISIPDNVSSIGNGAFENCTSLSTIHIPENIEKIGLGVFDNTEFYNNVSNWENGALYLDSILVEVSSDISGNYCIKSGTVVIADDAFNDCENLAAVDIPDSVKTIGESAFAGCSNLSAVEIPSSVKTIGHAAFRGCLNLSAVDIPNGVKEIGGSAFSGCSNLISVVVPGSITAIGFGAFSDCSELVYVNLCDGVKSLGSSAFENCAKLTTVSIPDSVDNVGYGVFSGTAFYNDVDNWHDGVLYCGSFLLEAKDSISGEFKVNDGTKVIAGYSFAHCTELTSVFIPDSVTAIGDGAFYDCKNLLNIEIPEGLTEIGQSAFLDCKSLSVVSIPKSVMKIGFEAFYNTALSNNKSNWDGDVLYIGDCLVTTSPLVSGDIEIKQGTRLIAEMAFDVYVGDYSMYSMLKTVTVPTGVKIICDGAFGGCYGMEKIVIPSSVTQMGKDVFSKYAGNLVIYGYSDSCAQKYAKENGIAFELLSKPDIDPPTEEPTTEKPTDPVEPPTDAPTDPVIEVIADTKTVTVDGVSVLAAVGDVKVADVLSAARGAKLLDKSGNAVNGDMPLATGMKIVFDNKTVEIAVLGDVDGNGEINVADARLALRQAVSLENLNGVYLFAGKVGGDSVGVSEARKILRAAVGLDDSKDWLK